MSIFDFFRQIFSGPSVPTPSPQPPPSPGSNDEQDHTSTGTDFDFRIGVVGPTRVGKTSLIASILKDSQQLLAGTPMKIVPFGLKTERRIAQHYKELEGSLRAGEFNPGAVSGTEEPFTFELRLDPGENAAGIRFNLLDYPGGWIDANRRPIERENEWEECKRWMTQSTVLIIPVDSAIIMEAASARHKKAVPSILNTYEIEQVARSWAKARASRPHEPALLLFCPMKCESYFADNGGPQDSSSNLFKAFDEYYREVLKAVKDEAPSVKMLYLPVDTIGCVEIINTKWRDDGAAPGKFVFSADYRVRPPGRQSVKGADTVLVSLCRHLVEAKKRAESEIADAKKKEATNAKNHAEKDEGFLLNLWLWASQERKRRKMTAEARQSEAAAQQRIVESLDKTIDRLASRDFGPRVREM